MEDALQKMIAHCEKMDKTEEEFIKKRWAEIEPPEIWKMTPEEVVKTAIAINRDENLQIYGEIPMKELKVIRNYLWEMTA